ncbi:uncharacterized protein LOC105848364 [Hydra vulgaris]|uniref:uncharacterized protein LOC105848364 n=1 Tax=Hydra vulgaris TaxID=6087 RepID=UPI0032EA2E8F
MALLSIINCGLICVGVAFAIFSITGNYWLSASFSHRGLWFNCSKACEKVHHKKGSHRLRGVKLPKKGWRPLWTAKIT